MVHFVPVTTMSVRTQIVDDVIDCAFTSYDYASAPDQEKDKIGRASCRERVCLYV